MKEPIQHQSIVLLNHLVSRSTSRAAAEHAPPRLSAEYIFDELKKRCDKGWAIEFERLEETDDMDELTRITAGQGHNLLRLRRMKIDDATDHTPGYVVLLFELLDHQRRSFPVVHTVNFKGRELAADQGETGGLSAHMVVHLPPRSAVNSGVYRCVVQSIPSITRARIESFLTRQIKRMNEWTFRIEVQRKRKSVSKQYHFNPRLELHADVARALSAGTAGNRLLSHLVFTKRAEKQSVGEKVDIKDRDLFADVKIKISAKQGPEDETEKATWAAKIRSWYETRGYTSHVYFRHAAGSVVGGAMHHQLEGAQDLLLCPKEYITHTSSKPWVDHIDDKVVAEMKALLDKDVLWERTR